MHDLLLPIQCFLTFVKCCCFLPLLLSVPVYGVAYGLSLLSAARADIRYPGPDILATFRLAAVISSERLSRRELPAMIYAIGLPSVIVLLILSLFYG